MGSHVPLVNMQTCLCMSIYIYLYIHLLIYVFGRAFAVQSQLHHPVLSPRKSIGRYLTSWIPTGDNKADILRKSVLDSISVPERIPDIFPYFLLLSLYTSLLVFTDPYILHYGSQIIGGTPIATERLLTLVKPQQTSGY